MKSFWMLFLPLMLLLSLALVVACGGDDDDDDSSGDDDDDDDDDDDGVCPDPTLELSVCDPANGPFSLTIDNEWYPIVVGQVSVLEGDDEGTAVKVEIEVLDETEDIAGVTTRVVTETEYEDDELVEISRNYFAQASDGTVCYFGEDTTKYEGGTPSTGDDSWNAGDEGAQAGIIMPADPQVGDAYFQEYLEGVAEDMGSISGFGDSIDVPAGTFDDTMEVTDYNALEGCEGETKYYVRGIGLAIDEVAELTSY